MTNRMNRCNAPLSNRETFNADHMKWTATCPGFHCFVVDSTVQCTGRRDRPRIAVEQNLSASTLIATQHVMLVESQKRINGIIASVLHHK